MIFIVLSMDGDGVMDMVMDMVMDTDSIIHIIIDHITITIVTGVEIILL